MATNTRPVRKQITTRIESEALETIERLAEEHRTTLAHVARVLLEDAARQRSNARRREETRWRSPVPHRCSTSA